MDLAYTHTTNTRSRSLRLRVDPDGTVVVTSPRGVPKLVIEKFVSQHQAWILNTKREIAQRKKHTSNQESVSIFGQEYPKKVVVDTKLPIGVHIQNNQVVVNLVDPKLSPEKVTNQLNRFLKATAEQYLVPRVHQLAQIMCVDFGTISLREQKSRWGSCTSAGNLQFNWRLVHYQPVIIDYVIIHELAHRVHMNHSAAFWKLVGQFDPEYQKHRGWLKRHGLSLG